LFALFRSATPSVFRSVPYDRAHRCIVGQIILLYKQIGSARAALRAKK
jgi:hypothetical protein